MIEFSWMPKLAGMVVILAQSLTLSAQSSPQNPPITALGAGRQQETQKPAQITPAPGAAAPVDSSTYKVGPGDILNIDVTVITKDGWFGDNSRMYLIGETSIAAKRLCSVTYEAMWQGIMRVKPGARLGDIGFVAEQRVDRACRADLATSPSSVGCVGAQRRRTELHGTVRRRYALTHPTRSGPAGGTYVQPQLLSSGVGSERSFSSKSGFSAASSSIE